MATNYYLPSDEAQARLLAENKFLKYPLNMFESGSGDGDSASSLNNVSPAYIKFNILEAISNDPIAGATQSIASGTTNTINSAANSIINDVKTGNVGFETFGKVGESIYASGEKMLTELKSNAAALLQSGLKTKPTGQSICLYMPPAIQINDSMAYDSIDTMGLSNTIREALGGNYDSLVKGGASSIISNKLLSTFAKGGGAIGGAIAQALINTGKVSNPATKLLFKGPALRQIQLDFKLVPTSQKEAMEITKIISIFRQCAYPGLDVSTIGALYTIPNLFDIRFAFRNINGFRGNPYMIHYKKCYLTQVTTTYNGSGVASFYKDGSPIETNLTLTFQETETNTAYDIHGQSNYGNYGLTDEDGSYVNTPSIY